MTKNDLAIMSSVLANLQITKEALEMLIMKTPTGPIRDALTEANIHFGEAEYILAHAHSAMEE